MSRQLKKQALSSTGQKAKGCNFRYIVVSTIAVIVVGLVVVYAVAPRFCGIVSKVQEFETAVENNSRNPETNPDVYD